MHADTAYSDVIAFLKDHGSVTSRPDMKPSISGSEMHDNSSDSMPDKKGVFLPKPEIPPSLPPLSEDDYDEVKFWRVQDWNKYVAKMSATDNKPPRLGFLTDEQGDVVSPERKKEFYD